MAALLLNLVVPGSGLILRRREWLGVALAGLFGMAVNVALGGWLLAPMAIPGWIKWSAAAIAVCAWALAQSLFLSQSAALSRRYSGRETLLREAETALANEDIPAARASLESALELDDEYIEAHVLWARLQEREGDLNAMKIAWTRVLKLDRQSTYRSEAERALNPANGVRAEGS